MGNRQYCEHCAEELEPCCLCKCHAKAIGFIIIAAYCAADAEYEYRKESREYLYSAIICMNVCVFAALYYCCGRSDIKERYQIDGDV